MSDRYRLFMDLDAFMQAAAAVAAPVAVQAQSQHVGGDGPLGRLQSALVVTAAPATGAVLAARIVVEETDLGLEPEATRRTMQTRSGEAGRVLRAALIAAHLAVVAWPEMEVVPGMLTDLRSLRCAQPLWRIARDNPDDPQTWRLDLTAAGSRALAGAAGEEPAHA